MVIGKCLCLTTVRESERSRLGRGGYPTAWEAGSGEGGVQSSTGTCLAGTECIGGVQSGSAAIQCHDSGRQFHPFCHCSGKIQPGHPHSKEINRVSNK